MRRFLLRPRARDDLDGIWDYTVQSWGPDQAKAYLRELNRSFKAVARKPHLGRAYDEEVCEGLRVYPSGKHLIFYFVTDVGVDIVRVLHERMAIPAHL